MRAQISDTVFMIEPVRFGYNPQTAVSNSFMESDAGLSAQEQSRVAEEAAREFQGLANILKQAGITVLVFQDTPEPHTPDAVFPNNWISTHNDSIVNSTIVLYPMEAENRRLERRDDIVQQLSAQFGFWRTVDLTHFERNGHYLEGTGSLLLDRVHQIVYANRSSRMDSSVLKEFCREMNFVPIEFTSYRADGSSIYHTNVMMALGEHTAVICAEAIRDAGERKAVLDALKARQKNIVEITPEQMDNYAGNMLQLRNSTGKHFWVMSSRAYHSLHPDQIAVLSADAEILHAPLDTIEKYGGGSARCMIAEVFTPAA